jgi:hypothetical protein
LNFILRLGAIVGFCACLFGGLEALAAYNYNTRVASAAARWCDSTPQCVDVDLEGSLADPKLHVSIRSGEGPLTAANVASVMKSKGALTAPRDKGNPVGRSIEVRATEVIEVGKGNVR